MTDAASSLDNSRGPRARGVTFDLDGTLYDARRVRRRYVWRNLTRLADVRVGRRVRESLRGVAFDDGAALFAEEARRFAARRGVDPTSARRVLDDIFGARLCAALAKVGPAPDARAAITRLVEAGLAVAVVSDFAVEDKLRALGLLDLPFGATIAADALGALKPDPRCFLAAADALGLPPGVMAHVGDRADTDGEGARAAGLRPLVLGRDAPTLTAAVDAILA